MNVADLTSNELEGRLRAGSFRLRTGAVVTAIQSTIASVARGLKLLYADHPLEPDDGFADFHVSVAPASGVRRFLRPQALFRFETASMFRPLPLAHAFAMLEWGMNWCVSNHCHELLVIHSAVVERGGRAVLLPAPPGSGKSTLCAALVLRGWRLLSDEMALLDPSSREVQPLPRAIGLKNASIDAIRGFATDVVLGEPIRDTTKGTVAHMKPPPSSVHAAGRSAPISAIVFPRYEAGADARMEPFAKAESLMRLVDNTFNYDVHGRRGFEALADVVDAARCCEFRYGHLDDAIEAFDRLARAF